MVCFSLLSFISAFSQVKLMFKLYGREEGMAYQFRIEP